MGICPYGQDDLANLDYGPMLKIKENNEFLQWWEHWISRIHSDRRLRETSRDEDLTDKVQHTLKIRKREAEREHRSAKDTVRAACKKSGGD